MGETILPSVVCFQIHCSLAKNKTSFFFISISQISYKQKEITVLNQEQVPKVAKHGTEVIKQTECFGCSNILCEHFSL